MHDLNDLRVFERVAVLGSYSKAAAALGMRNKPFVARVILRLERSLGVSLVQKSPLRGAPVVLTIAGRDLLRRSGPSLNVLTRAMDRAAKDGRAAQEQSNLRCPSASMVVDR